MNRYEKAVKLVGKLERLFGDVWRDGYCRLEGSTIKLVSDSHRMEIDVRDEIFSVDDRQIASEGTVLRTAAQWMREHAEKSHDTGLSAR